MVGHVIWPGYYTHGLYFHLPAACENTVPLTCVISNNIVLPPIEYYKLYIYHNYIYKYNYI